MAIQVIGAGFGRTGTLSLKLALEQLGFSKCYHMMEVSQTPGAADYWYTLATGGTVDWDEVFEGYAASVDWPSCAFYQEQMEKYPDAKVVLTVRDADKWYESCCNTIFKAMSMDLSSAPPPVQAQMKMANTLIVEGTFDNRLDDADHVKSVFEAHNAEVQRIVPPEKLLVFEVAQGWKPLCGFLGVPMPEGDFPRVNTTEEFGQHFNNRS